MACLLRVMWTPVHARFSTGYLVGVGAEPSPPSIRSLFQRSITVLDQPGTPLRPNPMITDGRGNKPRACHPLTLRGETPIRSATCA